MKKKRIIQADNVTIFRFDIIILREKGSVYLSVISMKGNIKYAITLDPGVWIFDDRKFLFNQDLVTKKAAIDSEIETIDQERQISEGNILPPTLQSEKKYKKQKMLEGTFAIYFEPFLNNAEPNPTATTCIFHSVDGKHSFSLEEARKLLFCFCKNGKPLRKGGPIHVYSADGTEPITNVTEIVII